MTFSATAWLAQRHPDAFMAKQAVGGALTTALGGLGGMYGGSYLGAKLLPMLMKSNPITGLLLGAYGGLGLGGILGGIGGHVLGKKLWGAKPQPEQPPQTRQLIGPQWPPQR